MMSVKWLEQKSGITILPFFDDFCDLLMNKPMTTWKTFVLYDKKSNMLFMVLSSVHLSRIQLIILHSYIQQF